MNGLWSTIPVAYPLYNLGLPELGADEEGSVEEDANRPLMGDDDADDDEGNYSIQAADTDSQPKAIGFFQACCLPGVVLVRTQILEWDLAYYFLNINVIFLCCLHLLMWLLIHWLFWLPTFDDLSC